MRTLSDDELIAIALASRPVVECHSESRDCAGCAHRGKARCRVPVLRLGHTVLPEITAKPGAAERGRTAGTKTMASRVDRPTDGRDAMNAQRKIDAETRVKGLLAAFDADPTWECLARLAAADGLKHESVCKKLRPFRDLPSRPNHGPPSPTPLDFTVADARAKRMTYGQIQAMHGASRHVVLAAQRRIAYHGGRS